MSDSRNLSHRECFKIDAQFPFQQFSLSKLSLGCEKSKRETLV